MDGTPNGETVTPTAPSNEPSAPATTPVVNAGQADVEAAKKEAEQARLRANQLENELKKLRDEQEAIKRKQLEENEQYKTLYEQANAKLAEEQAAKEAAERSQHLTSETQSVFADYPVNVVELAKTAGLGLSDDSDAAKAVLREKLDVFKAQVGPSAPVTPNNPSQPSSGVTDDERTIALREARFKGTAVHPTVVSDAIKNNPGLQRMREIAQKGV